MLADFLLRVFGHPAGEINDPRDKWPTVAADLIDFSVPYFLALLFFFPLFVTWWLARRKAKRFRDISIYAIVIALVIGGLLSWGGWWLNQWSYGYGQGVIFNEIYGP